MVPTIGVMVGLYIIMRCLSMMTRKGDRKESVAVCLFALVTTIVSLFGIVILAFSGIPKN